MHKTDGYKIPLILRDYNSDYPRNGELLLNYTDADLYYIDRNDGEKKQVAEEIWKKIIEARLRNTHVNIKEADTNSSGQSRTFKDYSAMITKLNSLTVSQFAIGDILFFKMVNPQELKVISNNESESSTYTYTTDAQFLADLKSAGDLGLQIGYYRVVADKRKFNTFYFIVEKRVDINQ